MILISELVELRFYFPCNLGAFWGSFREINMEGSLLDWCNGLPQDGLLLDEIVELLMEWMVKGETIVSVSVVRMPRGPGSLFSTKMWERCVVHDLHKHFQVRL